LKNQIAIYTLLLIISGLALISAGGSSDSKRLINPNQWEYMAGEDYQFLYLPRRDTIFITGDEYIEICLKTQTSSLHLRNDSTRVYPISSGTENISKGIKTSTGIFTVQSKIRLGISRQFNNAELINWIGFNGNIGFHGLRTNGYYAHLGKRPSSHGCVRISRVDGDSLYKYVRIGTPVIVYEEKPARVIAFLDENTTIKPSDLIIRDNIQINNYLKSRLDNLYTGTANFDLNVNLVLEPGTKLRKLKIPVGESAKIAGKQKHVNRGFVYSASTSDNTKFPRNYLVKLKNSDSTNAENSLILQSPDK